MPADQTIKQEPSFRMTLPRSFAAKICAVEGMVLSPALEKAFSDFDHRNLTPAQRRAEILSRFQRKMPLGG